MILKTVIAVVALLAIAFVARLVLLGAESRRPRAIAVEDRLAPCPRSPNCVSSRETRPAFRVEPLAAPEAPLAAARRAIERLPRARIVEEETGTYLRAECRSFLFGFVDDLELALDSDAGVLEVRSASRVGHSDLGANRRRVEELRALLAAER